MVRWAPFEASLSWLITGKARPMPAATVSNNNDWVFMEESLPILSWGPTIFRPIRLTPPARLEVPQQTPANAGAALAYVPQQQTVAKSVRPYHGVLCGSPANGSRPRCGGPQRVKRIRGSSQPQSENPTTRNASPGLTTMRIPSPPTMSTTSTFSEDEDSILTDSGLRFRLPFFATIWS